MLKTQHFILIKEARWISRSTKTEQNPKEEHEATFCPLFAWSEICYPLPSHKQRESLHLSASRWHPPAWEGAYSAERRIFTQTTETKDKATQNKKKHIEVMVGTDWCCRSVRARSVCGPIFGAESWQGRSSIARWLTFSVRTAALCCGECGAVITPNSDHFLHRDISYTASGTRSRGALHAATLDTAWSDTNWTSEPSKRSALFKAREHRSLTESFYNPS